MWNPCHPRNLSYQIYQFIEFIDLEFIDLSRGELLNTLLSVHCPSTEEEEKERFMVK